MASESGYSVGHLPVRRHSDAAVVLVLVAGQVAVAVLMSTSRALSTIHLAVTVGVAAAAFLSRRVEPMALAAAYIVGAENLWRVTGAAMPYLLPSYLVLMLMAGVALSRRRGVLAFMPVALIGALLPAAVATFLDISAAEARERVAFTLVPLVVLAFAVMAFSRYRATDAFRRRMVAAIVVPTAGLAFVVLTRTPSLRGIRFQNASNFLTSGGFGPDRIAASLGLGVLLCVLEAMREQRLSLLVIEAGLAIWLTVQSVLTFSRGGMASAVAAVAVACVAIGARRGQFLRALVLVGALAAVLLLAVLPRLNASTGGAFSKRFSNATTERVALGKDDLALFRSQPVFGVGAGEAAFKRPDGVTVPSHTEFTRLLAEHGMLGIGAIVLLIGMALAAARHASPRYRWYAVAVLTWCFAQMAYANLRLAAVAFVFGLAFLRPPEERAESVAQPATAVPVLSTP